MKILRLVQGATFLLVVFLACAYFFGNWIPNNPSAASYPIRGLDVSAHQGDVDWNAVAKSGISFVYLKATEGGDFRDAHFVENLRGAREAGLDCGAYHFFSLKTQGIIQAQNFIKAVPKDSVTLPPAIDLEFTGNSATRPPPEWFHEQFDIFLNAMRSAYGREPVIYTSNDFASLYLEGRPIKRAWVRAVLLTPHNNIISPWLFWQFTERGKVPGISGHVDVDVFNGSSTAFHLLTEEKQ